jgi:hypothetical protein
MMCGYHIHGMTKYYNQQDFTLADMDSIARMDQRYAPIRLAMRIADNRTVKRQRGKK